MRERRPSSPILGCDEDVAVGELLELRSRPTEVGGEHVGRIAGDPFRQIDILVDPGVEPDQDAGLPVADVFDRVPVPLRAEADVALLERLRPVAPARSEQRDADLTLEDILPLVGVGVPVQLPQRPRLEFEDRAGHGLGDRELGGIDQPEPAPLVVDDRIAGEELPLVRGWRLFRARERHSAFVRCGVCDYSSSSSTGRLALARIFSATNCGTTS